MDWHDNIKQVLSNRSSKSAALVSGDLDMQGDFLFKAPGKIDTSLRGTFSSRYPLEISPRAKLIGPVHAHQLTIHGSIEGDFTCKDKIEGTEGGRARGHGKAKSLLIHEGFVMEGSLEIGPV